MITITHSCGHIFILSNRTFTEYSKQGFLKEQKQVSSQKSDQQQKAQ